MQLTSTAAIVTGGASGLGAATAQALATAGADVFVLDLAAPAGSTSSITHLPVDITDAEAVQQAVDHAASGEHPLRTAVSCAGIAPSQRVLGRNGPHDPAAFAHVVGVNLIGTFHVMAAAASRMAEAAPDEHGQRGVIINTASIAAYDGQIGQAAYAASKGGVVGLTLPAARDLAQHGIRVMTIAPGIMMTPMMETVSEEFRAGLAAGVPFPSRLGRPAEYADLVLAIVANDYLNGEVVRLDGALRMAPR